MSKKLLNKQWAIAVCSSFAVFCTTAVFQPASVRAVEIPTTPTSISKAPYSRLFFTGSAYAVKDHDFKGDDRVIGFSTIWIKNPTQGGFQLGVRYCLPDESLADSGTYLNSMVLMNNNQPLVTINKGVRARPAQLKILRPSYYSYADVIGDPFWENSLFYDDTSPFWDDFGDIAYAPPVYIPPVSCSAGGSRFDISQLAGTIAQLPPKTLQVKLVFSNGATSNWRLGEKTVQALKDLVTIRQTPTNSSKPPTN